MTMDRPLVLTSPLLTQAGFSHGFFTRNGGYSDGPFASLNFTEVSGDTEENIEKNLRVAADTLGVKPEKIYFLTQVHGTDVRLVSPEDDRLAVRAEQGDIVLSRSAEVAAAIRTADCVPILLACRETGLVAACHSGWQGCAQNAAGATVRALLDAGARSLIASIGPHISLAAFEVSEDVTAELVAASPDKEIVDRTGAKPHIDLRKMVHAQLKAAGLSADDIDDVLGCTVLNSEDFYSFRRDANPSGRMLSAIVGGI